MDNLKALIREVPDFPKAGINFFDITTLMKDAVGLRAVIDGLSAAYSPDVVDVVVGIEARGYFFAPAIAYHLGKGFVPVRKPKKLPAATHKIEYALEYGTDILEIHQDAVQPGQRVLIVDDVLATGGTAQAVARLIEQMGGVVAGFGFVLELDFLKGRDRLGSHTIASLLHY